MQHLRRVVAASSLQLPRRWHTLATTSVVGKELEARLRLQGPLTVADYMRLLLAHPRGGYYAAASGDSPPMREDFVTAPELTQVFGEMLALWLLSEWQRASQPRHVRLVELGPGTGILMADVLNVLGKFFAPAGVQLAVDMVETSPGLAERQAATLTGKAEAPVEQRKADACYQQAVVGVGVEKRYQVPVSWWSSVEALPLPAANSMGLVLAHEFFDALPVHQLVWTEAKGWRERLVGLGEDGRLCFGLADEATAAVQGVQAMPALLPVGGSAKNGDVLEVCFDAIRIVGRVADWLRGGSGGVGRGSALIVDYGAMNGEFGDTFRAFYRHQQVSVLDKPGEADLTADVHFDHLKVAAQRTDPNVQCYGPVQQNSFLAELGITTRLAALLPKLDRQTAKKVMTAAKMLLEDNKMGARFKVMALSTGMPGGRPAGFG